MAGVRAASLVIMTSRICKRVLSIFAALTTAVYVHTKDLAAALFSHRQTVDRKGRHSFAEVWHEKRIPENIGIFFTASYTKNQLKTVQKIEHNLAYMDYAMIFCLQFYWLLVLTPPALCYTFPAL